MKRLIGNQFVNREPLTIEEIDREVAKLRQRMILIRIMAQAVAG